MSSQLKQESFEVSQISKNVHVLKSYYKQKDWEKYILFLSDLHWDNPKCDRVLLLQHLYEAKARNAKIIINGDLFCLMQGWGDPRSSKDDIRPEHNTKKYLDSVVETAVEFFKPFANNICLIGRGNHESSVLKRRETDILQRFANDMNSTHRPTQPIYVGGYGGWVSFKFEREKSKDVRTIKLKYYHGSGGGGPVTKGMIGNQRRQASISGADIIWSGHVHEDVGTTFMSETLNKNNVIELKEVYHLITSTYKEEYSTGAGGWHIERGAPPKPLGGAWVKFYNKNEEIKFDCFRTK